MTLDQLHTQFLDARAAYMAVSGDIEGGEYTAEGCSMAWPGCKSWTFLWDDKLFSRMCLAARTFVIARDQGIAAALLWKLQADT